MHRLQRNAYTPIETGRRRNCIQERGYDNTTAVSRSDESASRYGVAPRFYAGKRPGARRVSLKRIEWRDPG